MNNDYLLRAKQIIPDAKTLIVLASKRARALAYGARPMVRCKEDNHLDIALLEIAEGKLVADFQDTPENDFLQQLEAAKAHSAGAKEPGRNA